MLSEAKNLLRRIFLRLFHGGEVVFTDAAVRAYPVCRDIFESRSGGDAAVRVSGSRVIHITANVAYVLFHGVWFIGSGSNIGIFRENCYIILQTFQTSHASGVRTLQMHSYWFYQTFQKICEGRGDWLTL